jgi:hypothetical protein
MVTASMNSRRRSAMAFPATEFTASDDGFAGGYNDTKTANHSGFDRAQGMSKAPAPRR